MKGGQRIGFVQGELLAASCATARQTVREEMTLASRVGFELMEARLPATAQGEGPLLTGVDRREVRSLAGQLGLEIVALGVSWIAAQPFFRAQGLQRRRLLEAFEHAVNAAVDLGARFLVLPLEAHAALVSVEDAERLLDDIEAVEPLLRESRLHLLIRSELPPQELLRLISAFPAGEAGLDLPLAKGSAGALEAKLSCLRSYVRMVRLDARELSGDGDEGWLSEAARTLGRHGYGGPVLLQGAASLSLEQEEESLRLHRRVAEALHPGTGAARTA